MKKLALSLILLNLSLAPSAIASKPNMVAEVGDLKCLSKKRGDHDVIARSGITLKGANREEKKIVAQVVHTIIEMTNEQQANHLLSNLKVVFTDRLRERTDGGCLPAHQLIRNQIHMARYCLTSSGNNWEIPHKEGIFIHELGHFLANKHNLYPRYNQAVPKRKACKLSNYMTKTIAGRRHRNRNEEFAEVVSAYFIYPKALKRQCEKSFDFIKDRLFLGTPPECTKKSGGGF